MPRTSRNSLQWEENLKLPPRLGHSRFGNFLIQTHESVDWPERVKIKQVDVVTKAVFCLPESQSMSATKDNDAKLTCKCMAPEQPPIAPRYDVAVTANQS